MKLISLKICPFVQRVAALLEVKQISYEIEYIDLDNTPDWFLEISPHRGYKTPSRPKALSHKTPHTQSMCSTLSPYCTQPPEIQIFSDFLHSIKYCKAQANVNALFIMLLGEYRRSFSPHNQINITINIRQVI